MKILEKSHKSSFRAVYGLLFFVRSCDMYFPDGVNGRLHLGKADFSEGLRAGDLIFLDPTLKHYVRMTKRKKDIVFITIAF